MSDEILGFRFEMALLYACRKHLTQQRKGGNIPYIGHLLGVTSIVIEAGGNEDQAIAALLHDAIEDAGGEPTRREIERIFGEDVARMVAAASDEAPGTEERKKENWHIRKQGYLDTIPHKSEDALLVSLADKIYNARSILADLGRHGEKLWPRFNQGKERQLWYYRGLAIRFEEAAQQYPRLQPLAIELRRIVGEIGEAAGCPIDCSGEVGPCPAEGDTSTPAPPEVPSSRA